MTERMNVEQVFTPGKQSVVTYNPRETRGLEAELTKYVRKAGSILTIAGPTKMGKTVLVKRVIPDALLLQGSAVQSMDDFWSRLGSKLEAPTETTGKDGTSADVTATGSSRFGVFGANLTAAIAGRIGHSREAGWTRSSQLDLEVTARLEASASSDKKHVVVIDDFHFVPKSVRTEVIKALKPLAYAGVPVILITLQHHRREAVKRLQDVGGRTTTLEITTWEVPELEVIARKGFTALNVNDPGGRIGLRLAAASYGSPEIMQALCYRLCDDVNGVLTTSKSLIDLKDPDDWDGFFREISDELGLLELERLVQGPLVHGKPRIRHALKTGGTADGYQLVLMSLRSMAPKLSATIDEIKAAEQELVVAGSAVDSQLAQKLGHMSAIGRMNMEIPVPTDSEMNDDSSDPASSAEFQPSFEFDEQGAPPTAYIIDPFLAYAIRWHLDAYLK